jgi:carboxyl-terminal processing protease
MSIRNLPIYLALLSLIGLAFGVGYISYPLLHLDPEPIAVPVAEPVEDQAMDVYWQAWHLLERDFYGGKPDATARMYGAIRGMVEAYGDPYTYFVEPQPRALERDELRGKFGGIGAGIEQTPEGYILRPQPDQPAARAGVVDGDLLLMVDDREVTSQMAVDDVVALVRGPVGTEVTLVVRRAGLDGSMQQVTLRITREEIHTPSVEWRLLDDTASGKVGYLRHTLFTERSAEEMRRALAELRLDGADRFILDLRGNPGGLVTAAVEIADMWLDRGVVYIEEQADGTEKVQEATPGGEAIMAPLVVVVDAGTASASEILAGALQDHRRATLVGEQTFGKGSVQLIHELPDQSSLHVTNAQWLTPSRHQITGNGLLPDVPVAAGQDPLPEAIAVVESAAVAVAPDTQ